VSKEHSKRITEGGGVIKKTWFFQIVSLFCEVWGDLSIDIEYTILQRQGNNQTVENTKMPLIRGVAQPG